MPLGTTIGTRTWPHSASATSATLDRTVRCECVPRVMIRSPPYKTLGNIFDGQKSSWSASKVLCWFACLLWQLRICMLFPLTCLQDGFDKNELHRRFTIGLLFRWLWRRKVSTSRERDRSWMRSTICAIMISVLLDCFSSWNVSRKHFLEFQAGWESMPNIDDVSCSLEFQGDYGSIYTVELNSFPALPYQNNIFNHFGNPGLGSFSCDISQVSLPCLSFHHLDAQLINLFFAALYT